MTARKNIYIAAEFFVPQKVYIHVQRYALVSEWRWWI